MSHTQLLNSLKAVESVSRLNLDFLSAIVTAVEHSSEPERPEHFPESLWSEYMKLYRNHFGGEE